MSLVPYIPQTPKDIIRQQIQIVESVGLSLVKSAILAKSIPRADLPVGEIGRDKALYNSPFNNPVFSNFNVQSGSYTKNGQNFSFDEIKIDLALFQVQYAKNIVTTPMQGRDGTVKEYISDADYIINIAGLLVAPNNTFPLDEFVSLINVLKAPVPLKVNSWYLQKFGIYNIVVTNAEFSQQPGKFSQQAFNITALSDAPVELNIT